MITSPLILAYATVLPWACRKIPIPWCWLFQKKPVTSFLPGMVNTLISPASRWLNKESWTTSTKTNRTNGRNPKEKKLLPPEYLFLKDVLLNPASSHENGMFYFLVYQFNCHRSKQFPPDSYSKRP